MSSTTATLVYDGDCGICAYWVDYWQELTDDRVVFRPYQEAAKDFPSIPPEAFPASHSTDRARWACVFGGGRHFPRAAPRAGTRARGGGATRICPASRR